MSESNWPGRATSVIDRAVREWKKIYANEKSPVIAWGESSKEEEQEVKERYGDLHPWSALLDWDDEEFQFELYASDDVEKHCDRLRIQLRFPDSIYLHMRADRLYGVLRRLDLMDVSPDVHPSMENEDGIQLVAVTVCLPVEIMTARALHSALVRLHNAVLEIESWAKYRKGEDYWAMDRDGDDLDDDELDDDE